MISCWQNTKNAYIQRLQNANYAINHYVLFFVVGRVWLTGGKIRLGRFRCDHRPVRYHRAYTGQGSAELAGDRQVRFAAAGGPVCRRGRECAADIEDQYGGWEDEFYDTAAMGAGGS